MKEELGMTITMAKRIELWPVDRLRPYERNARTHSVEQVAQIAASIVEFGFTNPILVDSNDGIIAGHGRLSAAQELGLKTVPVVVLDHLSDRQRKAYILADNQLALNAGWDTDLLRGELQDLAEQDFDLSLIGFSDDELADLLPEIEELPPEGADEDAAPEVPEEPVTKLGDVWLLGKHRVMCGDSTDILAVERLMDGKKADMVFTDPPYGFNYTKKSDGASIANDGSEFEQVIADAFALVQVDTAYVCGDVKTARAFLRATSCLGEPKNCIVWVKPIQHRMHRYEPCHELIWFWGDNGSPFYGANVFEAKREIQKFHPTVKPVELVEYCLGSHKDKKLVLDLFGGSGSTLIACEKTSRQARLMELDPRYCDVIVKRWQQFTGKTAKLEATGERFPEDAA
jgi:ParB-like chromosome segregation protein Spo0J